MMIRDYYTITHIAQDVIEAKCNHCTTRIRIFCHPVGGEVLLDHINRHRKRWQQPTLNRSDLEDLAVLLDVGYRGLRKST